MILSWLRVHDVWRRVALLISCDLVLTFFRDHSVPLIDASTAEARLGYFLPSVTAGILCGCTRSHFDWIDEQATRRFRWARTGWSMAISCTTIVVACLGPLERLPAAVCVAMVAVGLGLIVTATGHTSLAMLPGMVGTLLAMMFSASVPPPWWTALFLPLAADPAHLAVAVGVLVLGVCLAGWRRSPGALEGG